MIGELVPWNAALFPTKFQVFDTGSTNGLAFVAGHDIEIAMIMAHNPGTGQFRDFVQRLKWNYDFVRFWALMNEGLASTLLRYGFTSGHDIDEYGQTTNCMDWVKQ